MVFKANKNQTERIISKKYAKGDGRTTVPKYHVNLEFWFLSYFEILCKITVQPKSL